MWILSVADFAAKGAVVILFALVLSVIIGIMVRRQAPTWMLLVLLLSPVVLLFSIPNWRLFSWHGWLHFSIVYEIFERGAPPSFPLLGGHELKYPYAFHLVVARAMEVIPLAPSWFFAALSITCLLGVVITLDRLASMIWADRSYRLLSISIAMLGCATLLDTPFGILLSDFFGLPFETRLDPLHKFVDVGVNALGLLFFAIALLGLAKIVGEQQSRYTGYTLFAIGFLGAGLFYPHAWLGSVIVAAATSVQLAFVDRPRRFRRAIAVAAMALMGSLLLLPWLLSIGTGKSEAASIRLFDLTEAPRKFTILVELLIIPALIVWFNRDSFLQRLNDHLPILLFLFLSMIGLQLSFLLIAMPGFSEYKLLMFSEFCLAYLLAIPVRDLFYKRYLVAFAALFFFALPSSAKIAPKLVFGWPVTIQAKTNSIYFEAADAEDRELYRWITSNTSTRAIFIDSRLELPVFGRRALFIGLDRSVPPENPEPDGWYLPASNFIDVIIGVASESSNRRRVLAQELLTASDAPLDETVISELRREVGEQPLYLVARDQRVRSRLSMVEGLEIAMENGAGMVLKLTVQ